MRLLRTGLFLCAAAGCAFDGSGLTERDGSALTADGSHGDASAADASPPDAPPPEPGDHLLLTEIKAHGLTDEFIEIYNPTDAAVALTDYYLSDDKNYAQTPVLFGGMGQPPNVDTRHDFIVRFPPGATIAPQQALVVALRGDDFLYTYGIAADFALTQTASTTPMLGVVLGPTPSLTDAGEGIVLFYWDGASDLVADVDMVTAGNDPTGANRLADKTDLSVDGPDRGPQSTPYAPDAYTIGDLDADTGPNLSYKRIAHEGTSELRPDPANGLTGHDETSEAISQTWDGPTYSPPTPGTVPASLLP